AIRHKNVSTVGCRKALNSRGKSLVEKTLSGGWKDDEHVIMPFRQHRDVQTVWHINSQFPGDGAFGVIDQELAKIDVLAGSAHDTLANAVDYGCVAFLLRHLTPQACLAD